VRNKKVEDKKVKSHESSSGRATEKTRRREKGNNPKESKEENE
jgi:hypothetical protein